MDLAAEADRRPVTAGRRETWVRAAVLAALVVFAAFTALSVDRLRALEGAVSLVLRENMLWAATQSEQELARFLAVVAQHAAGGEDAPAAGDVQERFDLLWSRVDTFRGGQLARSIAGEAGLTATIVDLSRTLEALDPLVVDLDPGDRQAHAEISRQLTPFLERLRRITMFSLDADRAERANFDRKSDALRGQLLVSGIGLLSILIASLLYLLRSEQRRSRALAEAQAARAETEQARSRLVQAVENISEGFVLFDAQDRLIICNSKYRELYPLSADRIRPGATFEAIVRAGAERGQIPEAEGRVDDWVAERLGRRLNDDRPHEQQLGDGRWVMASDRRTVEGGFVGTRTDITELKQRELELREAREHLAGQAMEMRRLADAAEEARALLLDAIESLDEGFSIYDADDRLVLFNRRYRALHPMLGDRLQPGIAYREVIAAVAASGAVGGHDDIDAFVAARVERRRADHLRRFEERHLDRWLRISNSPTRSGGVVSVFTDVTELKDVQAELRRQVEETRQARQVLDNAIESIDEGFCLYDADDRIVLCNSRHREFAGDLAPLVVPGATFAHLVRVAFDSGHLPLDADIDAAVASVVERRQASLGTVYEQRYGDGRWLTISNKRTGDGGLVSVSRDITERKRRQLEIEQAQAQLQEQAAQLQRLAADAELARQRLLDALSSSGDGFCWWDADDRLVFSNARYLEFHAEMAALIRPGVGYPELARAFLDSGYLVDVADRDALYAVQLARRQDARGAVYEEHYRNGRWLRIVNNRTGDGGTISVQIDITEQKQREARLAASEDRLRAIVNAAFDPVIVMDSQGLVREFNPAAAACFGYGRDEVMGQTLGSLIVPERHREAHARGMRHYLATGEGPVLRRRIEIEALRRNGEEFPVELAIDSARGEGGEIFVAFLRDITDRRRNEEVLQAARLRAEQASMAKSQFLAMMSHEIRTPLNGVLGALGLLDDQGLSTEERRLVGTARGSAEALLAILNDILDFSKIEAGKLTLEPGPFAPRALAESVVELCRIQADARGLQLTLELAPEVPPWLEGDAGRLRQMLLNFLTNALKFTAEGKVDVRIGRAAGMANGIRFEVDDTGIGIDRRHHDRLFGDFAQADQSISRRYGGTGLGLAITRRLAELMGGQVGFASEPGKGSRFWFDVPLPEAAAQPVAPGRDTVEPLALGPRRPRILLAEDNPTNQLLGRAMLERLGCTVDVVADGAEAVDACQQRPYDAVLMDIAMPVMDGLEATRLLRERGLTLPVLALTATTGPELAGRWSEAGMNGCVTKPVGRAELRAALAAVLRPPEPPAAAPRPEPDGLARLRTELDPATFAAFTASCRDDIGSLGRQLAAPGNADPETLRRAAHSLAGLAATIGAVELATLARQVEQDVSAPLPDAFVGELERLLAALQAAA